MTLEVGERGLHRALVVLDRVHQLEEQSRPVLCIVELLGDERAALDWGEDVAPDVAPEVARIKSQTKLPVIVGFGINTPEAAQGIASVADGCVVGSAIVKQIGEGRSVSDVLDFVASLAAGAHRA